MTKRRYRRAVVAVLAVTLAGPLVALTPANATSAGMSGGRAGAVSPAGQDVTPSLPAPPRPAAGLPRQRDRYVAPTALTRSGLPSPTQPLSAQPLAGSVGASAAASTWGSGPASTLVVYDTTDAWGWLGELYAMAGGNLASHFGSVTAVPVTSYVTGQVNNFTATVYIGSTYNEPIPTAFLNDVLATTRPVIWAASNIWQLSGTDGSAANLAFEAKYGWDPSTSYIDTTDNPATVSYKARTFSRNPANGANVLAPHIISPSAVTVLAQANCTDGTGAPVACAPIAQTTGTSFPWALRSANLTYVGEIPFAYISESDRYVIFADLLFPALAPNAVPTHHALLRLEDVSPVSNPNALRQFADYLSRERVPFTVGVIPEYRDPNGVYNGGTPQTITLAQAPQVVSALKYMQSKGGTILQHGSTHQYGELSNPYNGVSGDDAEFYRAQCSSTPSPPYTFVTNCQNTDWVIWTGPLPGDDAGAWASRVQAGRQLFGQAGLTTPDIFEVPHYFASPAAYAGIKGVYSTRYERELFVSGQLSGQPLDHSRIFGQFFPYVVHDVHGMKVIPENLGNYEPEWSNNNPPRSPADIIHNAEVNLAVTQGVASFFYHPDYPLSQLRQTVTGIQNLGYTFVSGTSLPG